MRLGTRDNYVHASRRAVGCRFETERFGFYLSYQPPFFLSCDGGIGALWFQISTGKESTQRDEYKEY